MLNHACEYVSLCVCWRGVYVSMLVFLCAYKVQQVTSDVLLQDIYLSF